MKTEENQEEQDGFRLKEKLKEYGYYNSFRAIVIALIVQTVNVFINTYYLTALAFFLAMGAILYAPIIREQWDDNYYKSKSRKK